MRLRSSLQISAVFPIILALVVILSLWARAHQFKTMASDVVRAETIVRLSTEMHSMLGAVLLRSQTATRTDWQNRHQALMTLLEQPGPRQAELIICEDELRKQLKQLLPIAEGAMLHTPGTPGAHVYAMSEKVCDRSLALLRTAHALAIAPQDNYDLLFSTFIAVAALLLTASTLAVSRSAIRRLRALTNWAGKLRSDVAPEPTGIPDHGDEIGELSTALNRAARTWSDSLSTVRRDVEETRRVADAAKQGNVHLSDALSRLKRAQERLIQQERLHALEQIVRGVAHDFNNTLTPILGTSDYMLTYRESLKDEKEVVENLQIINEAARLARDDVRKLSSFFHSGPGSEGPVDVGQVVSNAVQMTEPYWKQQASSRGATIHLITEFGATPPIAGDEADLRQAIMNLIMNAVDAMPSGGSISISTQHTADSVVVTIGDTGCGMSPEVKQRCQEPFFSTKGVEGSGLGLTETAGIVRKYRGTLSIDSTPGKGTTVRIALPVRTQESVRDQAPGDPATTAPRKLRILLVDDEQWVLSTVSRLLGANGHQVETAPNGTEAIRKVHAGKYDVIVTDMAMPEMPGKELAQKIKEISPTTPVVMLTGFGDLMIREGQIPHGVARVVSKPVSADELEKALAIVTRQD